MEEKIITGENIEENVTPGEVIDSTVEVETPQPPQTSFTVVLYDCGVEGAISKSALERGLENPRIKELLTLDCWYGCSSRGDQEYALYVDPMKVSHNIKGFWWDDQKLMGQIIVLQTPMGKILQDALIGDSEQVLFMPTGYRETDPEGNVNIHLVTFDFGIKETLATEYIPSDYINESQDTDVDNTETQQGEEVEEVIEE